MKNRKDTSINVRKRGSIAILITAAVLMLLISGIQQFSARKEIRNNLERNAEMELVIKAKYVWFKKEVVPKNGTTSFFILFHPPLDSLPLPY